MTGLPEVSISLVVSTEHRRNTIWLPSYVEFDGKAIGVKALIDSGADGTFISRRIVEKFKLPTVKLPRAIKISNVDGSSNRDGYITERVEGNLFLQGQKFPTRFYVVYLESEEVILGLPWIRKYGSRIDWNDPYMVIPDQNIRITRTTLFTETQPKNIEETIEEDNAPSESDWEGPVFKKQRTL